MESNQPTYTGQLVAWSTSVRVWTVDRLHLVTCHITSTVRQVYTMQWGCMQSEVRLLSTRLQPERL